MNINKPPIHELILLNLQNLGAVIASYIVSPMVKNSIRGIENSYGFAENDPREREFKEIYKLAFNADLPEDLQFRIGSNPDFTPASGIAPWINISKSYFDQLKGFAEKINSEQDVYKKQKLIAQLQVWLSAMTFHEKKHVNNQLQIPESTRPFLYYAQYQLNSKFTRLEEISAVKSQLSELREIVGELNLTHLKELFSIILYAEFAPELTKTLKLSELQILKENYLLDNDLEYLALYILQKLFTEDRGQIEFYERLKSIMQLVDLGPGEIKLLVDNFVEIESDLISKGADNKIQDKIRQAQIQKIILRLKTNVS